MNTVPSLGDYINAEKDRLAQEKMLQGTAGANTQGPSTFEMSSFKDPALEAKNQANIGIAAAGGAQPQFTSKDELSDLFSKGAASAEQQSADRKSTRLNSSHT